MGEVHIVITTESTEISNQAFARLHAIIMKSPALPFGKAEGNFKLDILEVTEFEGGRTLDTIQVIIEPRSLGDKHGARNTLDIDLLLELGFKVCLDHQQGFFLDKRSSMVGVYPFSKTCLGGSPARGSSGLKVVAMVEIIKEQKSESFVLR
jgi:hypothetical protein